MVIAQPGTILPNRQDKQVFTLDQIHQTVPINILQG